MNYIVFCWIDGGMVGPEYYVPKAEDEEDAVNQVCEWLFKVAGIKAPWTKEDKDCPFKIHVLRAQKLPNEIHAIGSGDMPTDDLVIVYTLEGDTILTIEDFKKHKAAFPDNLLVKHGGKLTTIKDLDL